MARLTGLPLPRLDALRLGSHRLAVLSDEELFASCGVRIAFTGREGGSSVGEYATLNCSGEVGDDDGAVVRNRLAVREAAGASDVPLVVPRQVHGTDLAWASDKDLHPVADGVLSGRQGAAVLMTFADCLPLVIVSPSGRFAVVHAGWRGALARIASQAAGELARGDAASVSLYNAYLGPHIHAECFEVGGEVEERFGREFGDEAVPITGHVSLAAAVTRDLEQAGLDVRRIADAGECTCCNPDRYFSYRASHGTCGRHAAFAVSKAVGSVRPPR